MRSEPAPSRDVQVGDREIEPVLQTLKSLTGITIPIQKKLMVAYRLKRRMEELGCSAPSAYLALLRRDGDEEQQFINLLTTNESSFFRTPRVWKYFEEVCLPLFYAGQDSRPMRIWSAAASTGEEAYSIALACLNFQVRSPSFRFHILATDVDTEVLAKAEAGHFCSRRTERLSALYPELLKRHFLAKGDGHLVSPLLKRDLQFRRHNLMESPRAFPQQDVVFLRNALIYFQEKEQIRILEHVSQLLRPGGLLIVGESESLASLGTSFRFIEPMVYRKGE